MSNGFIYLYAYGTWYVYDNQTIKENILKLLRATYQFVELEEVLYNVKALR